MMPKTQSSMNQAFWRTRLSALFIHFSHSEADSNWNISSLSKQLLQICTRWTIRSTLMSHWFTNNMDTFLKSHYIIIMGWYIINVLKKNWNWTFNKHCLSETHPFAPPSFLRGTCVLNTARQNLPATEASGCKALGERDEKSEKDRERECENKGCVWV